MYKTKALTLKRASNIVILAIFAFMLLAANMVTVKAEDAAITSFQASQSVFNPDDESVDIDFTVNRTGKITLEVFDGIDVVKTLALRDNISAGSHTYSWNGTDDNGLKVDAKSYKVQMFYYSTDFALFATDWVTVDYTGSQQYPDDVVSSHYVTPNPFNPDRQATRIYFTLEERAHVTVYVEQHGQRIRTMLDNVDRYPGDYYVVWDGRNTSHLKVSEGEYRYVVQVQGGFGTQKHSGYVEVDYSIHGVNSPYISNDYSFPNPFDPRYEATYIYFTLNNAADVDLKIYNSNNALVRTLIVDQWNTAGAHAKRWDGRNSNGEVVPSGHYTYEITASNTYGVDVEDGSVDAIYEDTGYNDPELTNAYVDPEEFDPNEGEDTTVHYDLNTCAYVSMRVYNSDNELVRTLMESEYQCEGSHSEDWDGRSDSNVIVPDGNYDIRIVAANIEGSDLEQDVVVVGDGEPVSDDLDVYDLDVDPYRFDPDDNEETELSYKLNECADVTVKVFDDDDDVVVVLLDEVNQCDGTHTLEWDGEDDDNDTVSDGEYYFKVYAENNDGSDSETIDVRVDTDGGDNDEEPKITDVDVDPERFDPYDEETELTFELNTCADVTIEVRDEDNDLVYEIIDDKWLCEGDHDYEWDGRDGDDDYVRQDDYEFYIRAENNEGTDTERADVEVDYNGHTVPDGDRCAGYLDVSINDPYCPAIEYVKGKGIFDGYPDGYFRPYQGINRAEATKVILKGFDYPILPSDGTNVGFWDVLPEAWYIPYLKTAVTYGSIIQGYPDGSFQPARVVNRVELLKIFLKSANVATPYCSIQPYPDTPIQADTEWYMGFVCYSKMHNLMDPDYYGNFNPAKPMTRGDVAELFYRFDHRGLGGTGTQYTYGYERPRVSNLYLSDDEMEEGDTIRIYFTLDSAADVTIEVLDDDDDVVREILDDSHISAGERSVKWDGEDDDGDDVKEGDYTIRVIAENSLGRYEKSTDLEILESLITDLELSDDRFDPDNEVLEIEFRLNDDADVTVKVYDDDNDLVRELWDDEPKDKGMHDLDWDGLDDNDDELPDGDYTIKVIADDGSERDREEIEVEINY